MLRIFKIAGHPYTLVIVFCLLLISGENFGGVYLLYLLMALPHGSLHALLGFGGIVLLLCSRLRPISPFTEVSLNTAGLACMLFSIFIFFGRDSSGYNLDSFHLAVPLASFILFGVLIVCSVANRIVSLMAER